MTAQTNPGFLTTPRFPNNYGNNLDCFWSITAASENKLVEFVVLEGRIQQSKDFMEVNKLKNICVSNWYHKKQFLKAFNFFGNLL